MRISAGRERSSSCRRGGRRSSSVRRAGRCRPAPPPGPSGWGKRSATIPRNMRSTARSTLGHEIDGALLVDAQVTAEPRHLEVAGPQDGFDGGGEKEGIDHARLMRLRIRTSMPPPTARWMLSSSMKLRMKKMPRPLALRRFSGASGSGSSSGSNPSAVVPHADEQFFRDPRRPHREVDLDRFRRVVAVAVLDRVDDRLADRDLDPVPGVLVELQHAAKLIDHRLDEIDHLEETRKVDVDGVTSLGHGGNGLAPLLRRVRTK